MQHSTLFHRPFSKDVGQLEQRFHVVVRIEQRELVADNAEQDDPGCPDIDRWIRYRLDQRSFLSATQNSRYSPNV